MLQWYRGDTMECFNHINQLFNEMLDDVQYIKRATFVEQIKR